MLIYSHKTQNRISKLTLPEQANVRLNKGNKNKKKYIYTSLIDLCKTWIYLNVTLKHEFIITKKSFKILVAS
jgi:hypothetical protein